MEVLLYKVALVVFLYENLVITAYGREGTLIHYYSAIRSNERQGSLCMAKMHWMGDIIDHLERQ